MGYFLWYVNNIDKKSYMCYNCSYKFKKTNKERKDGKE